MSGITSADLCQEPEWQLPPSNSGARLHRVAVRLELQRWLHLMLQCGAATSLLQGGGLGKHALTLPGESKLCAPVMEKY